MSIDRRKFLGGLFASASSLAIARGSVVPPVIEVVNSIDDFGGFRVPTEFVEALRKVIREDRTYVLARSVNMGTGWIGVPVRADETVLKEAAAKWFGEGYREPPQGEPA